MAQNNKFEVRIVVEILLVLLAATATVEGVTCKVCLDVDNPSNCSTSNDCGNEEICSTEEYIDGNGLLSYRLGCANAARCKLFVDAKTLFGKREISRRCYECCEKDDCNANLCQGFQACPTGCPLQYVPFKDKCYFMSPSDVAWQTADRYCRGLGQNLVSVNTKEEHDFLLGLANQIKAGFTWAYWTGGFYSHNDGKYGYTDGSPFNYTLWFGGEQTPSANSHAHEALLNPTRSPKYHDLPEMMFIDTIKLGFICETKRN